MSPGLEKPKMMRDARTRFAGVGWLPIVALLCALAAAMVPAAARAATPLYAYAGATTTGLTSCPQTATAAQECSLGEALGLVAAGQAIDLATPGASGHYVGNWTVSTAGTSAAEPVTLQPAANVADPILDGNDGNATGCSTAACDTSVLTNGSGVFLDLDDLTVENADNTAGVFGTGGAITNDASASLTIAGSTLSDDTSVTGGAISNNAGQAKVTVTGSTFDDDVATDDGGAIDTGDDLVASGLVTISGSTFDDDSAASNGGAIDTGDVVGIGTTEISTSTFDGDSATDGGALDNGDLGAGTTGVTDATFANDTASAYGGAIDNANGDTGTATVVDSTFDEDTAGLGGALETSEGRGDGKLTVVASTIDDPGNGEALAFGAGTGSLGVAGSIVAGSCAGTITDAGDNLQDSSTASCGFTLASDRSGASDLAALAGNGGSTQTMALSAGSAAIGLVPDPTSVTVNAETYALCPGTDQRGDARPGSGASACDAGAYETQGAAATASGLIVSELRLTGPASAPADVYVDLYNDSGSALSLDGWSLAWRTQSGSAGSTALSNVTLAAGAHYLLANTSAYSLATAADQDLGLPAGSDGLTGVQVLGPNGGVSDTVGYAGSADAAGTGLTVPAYPSGDSSEIAFVRRYASGVPIDTGDNAGDFVLVAPDAGSQTYGEPVVLGVPAPSDASSPVQVDAIAQSSLYAPSDGQDVSPNLTYVAPAGGVDSAGTPGTLVIRRTITDTSTTQAITRLQLRITGLSTYGEQSDSVFGDPGDPSAAAILSDMDVPSAEALTGVTSAALTSVGPGLNSTLSIALPPETGDTSVAGLAPGQSMSVAIAFDVFHGGSFALAYNLEDDLATYHREHHRLLGLLGVLALADARAHAPALTSGVLPGR